MTETAARLHGWDTIVLGPETYARVGDPSPRAAILAAFEQVAASQEETPGPRSDDTALLDSGLDSLCFAVILATLEDDLGFDPFTLSDDVHFPVTVGDFVRFYDDAAP